MRPPVVQPGSSGIDAFAFPDRIENAHEIAAEKFHHFLGGKAEFQESFGQVRQLGVGLQTFGIGPLHAHSGMPFTVAARSLTAVKTVSSQFSMRSGPMPTQSGPPTSAMCAMWRRTSSSVGSGLLLT